VKKFKAVILMCGLLLLICSTAQASLSTFVFMGSVLNSSDTDYLTGSAFKSVITIDSSDDNKLKNWQTYVNNNEILSLDATDLADFSTTSKTSPYYKFTASNATSSYSITYDGTGSLSDRYFSIEYLSEDGVPATLRASVTSATPTPIPAAAWLLGSGLLGMVGLKRRKTTAA
jgi:hypothetical protein